jgi:hypothetical protein
MANERLVYEGPTPPAPYQPTPVDMAMSPFVAALSSFADMSMKATEQRMAMERIAEQGRLQKETALETQRLQNEGMLAGETMKQFYTKLAEDPFEAYKMYVSLPAGIKQNISFPGESPKWQQLYDLVEKQDFGGIKTEQELKKFLEEFKGLPVYDAVKNSAVKRFRDRRKGVATGPGVGAITAPFTTPPNLPPIQQQDIGGMIGSGVKSIPYGIGQAVRGAYTYNPLAVMSRLLGAGSTIQPFSPEEQRKQSIINAIGAFGQTMR